jgi:hypothetical protein
MTSILKVSEIQDPTNGNSALTVDSSGRILTPARPAFSAYRTAGSGSGTTGVIVFNNEDHDVGSCYNTSDGKFTAPIAGIYHFDVLGFYCLNAAAAPCTPASYFSYLYKNNNIVAIHYAYFSGSSDTQYLPANINLTLQLAANDVIHYGTHSSTYLYADSTRGYATFSGYLVG